MICSDIKIRLKKYRNNNFTDLSSEHLNYLKNIFSDIFYLKLNSLTYLKLTM